MARYAQIGVGSCVENLLVLDDPSRFPSFTLVQSDTACIGDLYDPQTGEFARQAPEPPPPRVIPKSVFKMRIPPQKYGALRDLAQTDPVVWAFLDVLNDATLTEVELGSPYLVGAMQYLLQAYPQLITHDDVIAWTG